MRNRAGMIFVFAVLCALLFTGCSGEAVEEKNGSGYIVFSVPDGASRTLTINRESDNLVWAYVAVKKDGLHTEGSSKVVSAAEDGKTQEVDGKIYALRPVKGDYGTGLDSLVGPFAWGEWQFVLYGYEKFEGGKFTNLCYTAKPVGIVKLNPLTGTDTSVEVNFETDSEYKGKLFLGDIKLRVPEGMKFYATDTIEVTFTDTVATDPVAPFTGMVVLTEDKLTGETVQLEFENTELGIISAGVHKFKVGMAQIDIVKSGTAATEYVDCGTSTVFAVAGEKNILQGEVTELVLVTDVLSAFAEKAVCKATVSGEVKYYKTLNDAFSAGATEVTLVANVEDGGTVSPAAGTVNCENFYVKNLTVAAGKSVTLRDNGTGKHGIVLGKSGYTKATVVDFYYGKNGNIWMSTNGGRTGATGDSKDAELNVYHTGKIDVIDAVAANNGRSSNRGYHLDAQVSDYALLGSGFLEICAEANIKVLKLGSAVTGTNSAIRGKSSSVVGNIDNIRDGSVDGTAATAFTAAQKGVFSKNVTLHYAEAGTSGTTAKTVTYCCIEGMYVNLEDPRTAAVITNAGRNWYLDEEMRTNFVTLPVTVLADDLLYSDLWIMQYEKLNYLQNSGDAYIDTEYKPVVDTRVVCTFDYVSATKEYAMLFGSQTSDHVADNFRVYRDKNGNGIYCQVGVSSRYFLFNDVIGSGKHILEMSCYYVALDDTGYYFANDKFIGCATKNLYLFCCSGDGSKRYFGGTYKYYGMEIYEDSYLVKNFVPVRKVSDRTLGLWDTVSRKFYTNAGASGTGFTAGELTTKEWVN